MPGAAAPVPETEQCRRRKTQLVWLGNRSDRKTEPHGWSQAVLLETHRGHGKRDSWNGNVDDGAPLKTRAIRLIWNKVCLTDVEKRVWVARKWLKDKGSKSGSGAGAKLWKTPRTSSGDRKNGEA